MLRKMRSKETEADYRYFREPDLLPVRLDDAWRAAILAELARAAARAPARASSASTACPNTTPIS